MSKQYSNENTFANLNAIKKLSEEIELVDIINPSEDCVAKLMELVSRSKCIEEFQILEGGDLLFEGSVLVDSPGVGKIRC